MAASISASGQDRVPGTPDRAGPLGQPHDLGEIPPWVHRPVEAADDPAAAQEAVDVDRGPGPAPGDPDQSGDAARSGQLDGGVDGGQRSAAFDHGVDGLGDRLADQGDERSGIGAGRRADEGVGTEMAGGVGLGRVDVHGDDPGRAADSRAVWRALTPMPPTPKTTMASPGPIPATLRTTP